jgi:NAD(P)-dependent dehydrogenase (short-subunit alcohol dehydrogenase family)
LGVHVKELFDLSGRVALVTGGSRGLGLEIATGLGEAGAKVAITARREKWLTPAQQQLSATGITALALICDVSNPDDVTEAVAATLRTFGRVDVLINNAGTAWGAPAESMTLDKWRQVMETNATGCFLMSQAVGREMIRAGHGGAIVNMASYVAGFGSDPEIIDAVAYAASKGAVVSLTRDLAVKWARHGIRVNAIAPGYFDTRLSSGVLEQARGRIEAMTPMRRIGRADEMKGAALFLAAPAAAYVTGHVLAVDGGMTAV